MIDTQNKIANRTIRDINKQLVKYYKRAMLSVIKDFESTYDKLLATIDEDKEPTPADLYKMDRFWQLQNQLKQVAQKLGDKEIALLSKEFEKEWYEIYNSTMLPSDVAFSTLSESGAKAMIDTVWLSDGKNFSQRVWGNTDKLVRTLNEELMNCVVTGKKTSDLKKRLVRRFEVSMSQAHTLVTTEVANIQTQAAVQRYKDYGLKYYEFFADTDERTCKHGSDSCAKLDGKKFLYSEMVVGVNCPPLHPNCRCTIMPVIE